MDIINYRKLFRVSIEVEQITEASVLAGMTTYLLPFNNLKLNPGLIIACA